MGQVCPAIRESEIVGYAKKERKVTQTKGRRLKTEGESVKIAIGAKNQSFRQAIQLNRQIGFKVFLQPSVFDLIP